LLPRKQQIRRKSEGAAIFHIGEQDSYLVAAETLVIPTQLRHAPRSVLFVAIEQD
jgi:hypothetical protein